MKKFPQREKELRNLAQVIKEKSTIENTPRLSAYRKAENERTKENFSTEHKKYVTSRSASPNPLTGEGYSVKKKGIKTVFKERDQNT